MDTSEELERIAALQDLRVLDTAPEAVFDSLTQLAALTFNAPVALVSLVDTDRQWFKSCIGLDVSETGRDVAFCDHAIRQDQAMVVLDASQDQRFRDNPLVTGAPSIRFYAGAPLILPDGHRLGTLCVIDFAPRQSFSQAARAQLEAMAASVTQALLMRRDISTFQRLERERNNQRQLLDQAEELAGVGHWSWDAALDVTTWSRALYEIHGCDPAEPPPGLEGVLALYAPEDAAKLAALVERAVATGESYALQARILRPDGRERLVSARGAPAMNIDGSVAALFGTFVDVTDLKLADQRLRQNEARLQFLTEHAADLIFRVEPGRGILWVSPNCARYGYQPDELIGVRPAELVHPDDLPSVQMLTAARLAGLPDPEGADYRYRVRRKDGGWTWMETSPTVIRDASGRTVEVVSVMRDITDRMEMEIALAASEARYRLMATRASDIIACYGVDEKFTFLSPAIEKVLGYTPDDLLGRATTELMHPDDVRQVRKAFIAYLGAGPDAPPLQYGYRAFRKDGATVWLEAHARAIYDADTGRLIEFQDTLRDVTQRKAVESALAESEMRHSVIGEYATDIISRSSLSGRLLYASPSITQVTGFTAQELSEHKPAFLQLIHPDDLEPSLAHVRRVISGEICSGRLSYRFKRKDGNWIWLECNPTLVRDADGKPSEILDVIRDVSAQRQIEADLLAARDAAEGAARVKSDFMANMSHEIRTPLTAILGFTRLLTARQDLAPEASAQLGRVATASDALLSIVNDVLDFSKLEAGQTEIKPRPVSPRGVLHDALSMFSPLADAKGLSLSFAADDLPDAVRLDPDRIRQVLLNLIGNAVKFTSTGGVRLVATYDQASEQLAVAVEDTGAGMSDEQCERLFKRFSQVDGSSTRQHGGTGLGLAICKGLVEAMGGAIGVNSRPGLGSTFHFKITAPEAAIVEPSVAETNATEAAEGLRVLVVDDNAANRELVNALLSRVGVEVLEAADGPSAIEAASLNPVDLILLDLRMPGMSGPETLARIRQTDGPNQNIPILAFTADDDLARLGPDHGFDGLVRKPIVATELIDALQRGVASFETSREPVHRAL
ncbi:MAG: PAS domain S-box protein [Phenylobacterium sp.]|uniref:PAS domain S-box protein n=1 Tax=Phenylobacterium sp. TaxID=1871053 RepID=UPI0027161273|nr:PAS domain S-box protein [Phenylobacterium sp.]MDO8911653.1 PAS domain S-box protein [Phenylobacterium sp.]